MTVVSANRKNKSARRLKYMSFCAYELLKISEKNSMLCIMLATKKGVWKIQTSHL